MNTVRRLSAVGLFAASLFSLHVGVAGANLLQNGSFGSGDFTGWTLGTTSNGTAGQGFPIVTAWPLGGTNSAKYEVGEVNFDGTNQGATLSQSFTALGGMTTLSFMWAAQGDGIHTNSQGGIFELILDGVVLASTAVGQINPNDLLSGMLSDTLDVAAGMHTFEIDILRPFVSEASNTPYQYVTGADVERAPEPATLTLLALGLAGLGFSRRKR